ncbi:hypothetical protein [Metabacillus rhizolycopersici]|uniref:DUF3139 domain-containing protein n=1 Tax=Metabacillus rhizolycopersici TaxID=2875709 RepID=A0ABS7UM27_9BACI|nr:hypothetical protein [Metabacillus rhizolycopersici]MBZ5748914.1 hypothetical protein [Metabacillus rhizolycopersici]
MKKIAPLLILVAAIAIIGYLDSPLFAEREDAITSLPVPTEETASANASNDQSNQESQQIPLLESKLVEITEDDGYFVEVYREYEVYKDHEGNIIESKPTENYQYLRYKE